MAQTMPINAPASLRPLRVQFGRPAGSALLDVLARSPRVSVLADFRDTTGCLIIACPFARHASRDHRCAVMGPTAERRTRIACIHPDCWHLTTEDFLERLHPAPSGLVDADYRFDAAYRERQRQVILAVLNHHPGPAVVREHPALTRLTAADGR